MSVKVFIDGSSGTTGLRIADRLAQRPEIELLSISAEGRKDVNERAKVINSADLAFLCLPDAASKEVMPLLRPDVKVLDTSTAFRTDAACQRLYQHCPPAGGAGPCTGRVSLQLHRHLRLLRRRQKDDRRVRER